jgi:hypothetical protein
MAERKSFLLRIDPALWSDIEAWAQAELRSVNGQIEFLLRQAVQKRKHSAPTTNATAPGETGETESAQEPEQGESDSGGAGLDSSGPDVSLL